LIISVRKL